MCNYWICSLQKFVFVDINIDKCSFYWWPRANYQFTWELESMTDITP